MYSAIIDAIKQREDRAISFCKAKFRKIRDELKLGDTSVGKSTSEKERVSQDKVVDDMDTGGNYIFSRVQNFDDGDGQFHNTPRHEKSEDESEKEKVVSDGGLEKVVGS
ncbi:hypothetical protein Ddye_008195 [Dipteronia dyeriana]|uniref:Uncharacterized protein n=1 Tax=Dipteronia dyeriana TaxID=168575 RepID=A0AAD9X9F3_9ROSI|nr:hypothetical protein Ddye_008195 [Dipteronia dyeriana]